MKPTTHLANLEEVIDECLPREVGLHLLPPYPSCGDYGFAVVDHLSIDPIFGTWQDIESLSRFRAVMLDVIVNHVGSQSSLGRRALAAPWAVTDEVYAYRRAEVSPSNHFSPRGGSVFRVWVEDPEHRLWTVWQTFGEQEVDVRIESERQTLAREAIFKTIARHGVSWARLDAVGYFAKELGAAQFHHPIARRLAAKVAEEARRARLAVVFQLDSDSRGLKYVEQRSTHDIPVIDYGYTFYLILSQLTGNPEPLGRYLSDTAHEAHNWLRAFRNHDGVLLRPARVGADCRASLIEFLGEHRVVPRMSNGTPYEFNESYPFLMSIDVPDTALHERRMLAGLAITLLVSGIPYLYFPAYLGYSPESASPIADDPRASNRRPVSMEHIRRLRREGRLAVRKQMVSGILRARARRGPIVRVDHAEEGVILMSSEGGQIRLVVNLTAEEKTWRFPSRMGVVASSGIGADHLGPFGWGVLSVEQ